MGRLPFQNCKKIKIAKEIRRHRRDAFRISSLLHVSLMRPYSMAGSSHSTVNVSKQMPQPLAAEKFQFNFVHATNMSRLAFIIGKFINVMCTVQTHMHDDVKLAATAAAMHRLSFST